MVSLFEPLNVSMLISFVALKIVFLSQSMFGSMILLLSFVANKLSNFYRLYDYMIKFTESPSLGTKMDIQKKANEWYTNRINGFIKNGKPNSAKPFQDIQDMMNTMMNELYTREAKINNLDSLVDNVYNASVPAYSQSYLKNNPLILMSLKKAFTMSGAGDDRVAMALRKSLGIPDSVDSQDAFAKFLNSSDGTELR